MYQRYENARVRQARRRRILVAAVAGAVAAAVVTSASLASNASRAAGPSGTVAFMIPNAAIPRYANSDAPALRAALKKLAPGLKLQVINGLGDPQKQLQQAETAINQGVKAIVLTAADPNLSGGILQKAASGNVPVVAYEHEALDGPLFGFVVFDPFSAGDVQGKYFAHEIASGKLSKLKKPVRIAWIYGNKGDNYNTQMLKGQSKWILPLVKAGKVKVVCQDYTPEWDPAKAQTEMEQCLTKTQSGVDAVLGFYDGITQGAIAALQAQNLQGKIPVYGGQNPELSGLQYMLAGWQEDNVLKPYAREATAAAKLVVAALSGKTAKSTGLVNGTYDNKAGMVPLANLPVMHIVRGQEDLAVKFGIFTWKQICVGVAAKTPKCKKALGG
jgi:D-xylose transport system substrate-binding protein